MLIKPIFVTMVGSQLYGTAHAQSDKDFKGFCFEDFDQIYGLNTFEQQEYKNNKPDGPEKVEGSIFSVRRFIRLCLKGNPTVIEVAFANSKYWIHQTQIGQDVTEFIRENMLTKHLFRPYSAYHQAQIRKLQSQERVGKRKEMVEKYGYDCYEKETTEFLTNNGWKWFDDITDKDLLATINVKTGKLKWSKQLGKMEKDYTGNIFTLNNKMVRCAITENHNILVSPVNRQPNNNFSRKYKEASANWHLVPIKKIYNNEYLNKDGNAKTVFHIKRKLKNYEKEYPFVEDWYLKLSGLFISEGTIAFIPGHKVRYASIVQTTNGKLTEVLDIIKDIKSNTDMDIKQYIYSRAHIKNRKEYYFRFPKDISIKLYKDYGHGCSLKKLPNWCFKLSYRQAKILWDSMIVGDGTIYKNGEVLYTTSKYLADDCQRMMTLSGHIVSIRLNNYKYKNKDKTCYQIYRPKDQSEIATVGISKNKKYNNDKQSCYKLDKSVINQKVVCFETSTGTIITRNNGKVAFQGNCKFAGHAYRLARQCQIVFSEGVLRPTLDQPDIDIVKEIYAGKYNKEQVLEILKEADVKMYETYKASTLPEKPDFNYANAFVMNIYKNYIHGQYDEQLKDSETFAPFECKQVMVDNEQQ